MKRYSMFCLGLRRLKNAGCQASWEGVVGLFFYPITFFSFGFKTIPLKAGFRGGVAMRFFRKNTPIPIDLRLSLVGEGIPLELL